MRCARSRKPKCMTIDAHVVGEAAIVFARLAQRVANHHVREQRERCVRAARMAQQRRRAGADRRESRRSLRRPAALRASPSSSPESRARRRAASCASSRVKSMTSIGENHALLPVTCLIHRVASAWRTAPMRACRQSASFRVGQRDPADDSRQPSQSTAGHTSDDRRATRTRRRRTVYDMGGSDVGTVPSFRRRRPRPPIPPRTLVLYICIPAYNEAANRRRPALAHPQGVPGVLARVRGARLQRRQHRRHRRDARAVRRGDAAHRARRRRARRLRARARRALPRRLARARAIRAATR